MGRIWYRNAVAVNSVNRRRIANRLRGRDADGGRPVVQINNDASYYEAIFPRYTNTRATVTVTATATATATPTTSGGGGGVVWAANLVGIIGRLRNALLLKRVFSRSAWLQHLVRAAARIHKFCNPFATCNTFKVSWAVESALSCGLHSGPWWTHFVGGGQKQYYVRLRLSDQIYEAANENALYALCAAMCASRKPRGHIGAINVGRPVPFLCVMCRFLRTFVDNGRCAPLRNRPNHQSNPNRPRTPASKR